jgi:predicted N-formylglutamate amidohydrolase
VPLLALDEPPAFEVVNPDGVSRFLLLCDHASLRMPRALGTLGLPDDALRSHIAWDIGAADVAKRLSELLDAPLVLSGYSRLAIDCNRPPGTAPSIPDVTCEIVVPGNAEITGEERDAREAELFWPYHHAVERLLEARDAHGADTILLSVHSFTPSLYGKDRPWHVGVMYGHDPRLARLFLAELAKEPALVVGDNEPYHVSDGTDYGVPVYAERAGRLGLLLELRQDLVGTPDEAKNMAELVARVGCAVLDRLSAEVEAQ